VPESQWPELPINPQTKKLDKSCFVFVPEENLYYCPQGQPMPLEKTKPDTRQGQKITLEVYRCTACDGCPLASVCVSEKSRAGRTVTRDRYTADRERHAEKMRQEASRARYAHRFHSGETPFGWLKHVLGLHRLQPEEADQRDRTIARPIRGPGRRRGNLGVRRAFAALFFRPLKGHLPRLKHFLVSSAIFQSQAVES
jgi:hypothetical protein